jgi:hypothetical protein
MGGLGGGRGCGGVVRARGERRVEGPWESRLVIHCATSRGTPMRAQAQVRRGLATASKALRMSQEIRWRGVRRELLLFQCSS